MKKKEVNISKNWEEDEDCDSNLKQFSYEVKTNSIKPKFITFFRCSDGDA